MNGQPLRICSIINGTVGGAGAERMLQRLVRSTNNGHYEHLVISIKNYRQVAEELAAEGIAVESLNIVKRYHRLPLAFVQLVRRIREFRPDIVQTWLYMSDLLGGLASRLASLETPVVWTVRHSTLNPRVDSFGIRSCAALCGRLSRRVPDRIVFNSHSAIPVHCGVGYVEQKCVVIPNGFDTGIFRPDKLARDEFRRKYGIPVDAVVVGRVARFHPHKDHHTFLDAARRMHAVRPDIRFVMCGEATEISVQQIESDIAAAGLSGVVQVVEPRSRIAEVNAAFDIAACTSLTEAFPNAVGEAMACGVPCVSTDVGDASRIIRGTGRIVPVRDAEAFAGATLELLALSGLERQQLGMNARQVIVDNYSLHSSIEQYVDLWLGLAEMKCQSSRDREITRRAG